jgi:hypothetical protein
MTAPEEAPRTVRMRVTITAEYETDPRDYRPLGRATPAAMAESDKHFLDHHDDGFDEFLDGKQVTVEVVPLVVEDAARAAVEQYGERKIFAIKAIREQTGCGLLEAKNAVEAELARRGLAGGSR